MSEKEPRRGVGTVIREGLRAGLANDAILTSVKEEFPEAKTTAVTVTWYRNDLRKKGEKIPTAKEAASATAE